MSMKSALSLKNRVQKTAGEWCTKKFDEWCVLHGKTYDSLPEKARRMTIFERNCEIIEEHNARGDSSITLGLTAFADMSWDEFRLMYGGTAPTRAREPPAAAAHSPRSDPPPPRKWDWRKWGAVTRVKNQFGLRTCYAMSAADAIESVNYIKTGSLVELSAQEILDCAPGHSRLCNLCGRENSSCPGKSGGNVIDALIYVKKHGISYERDYPYTEALLRAVIRQPVIVHLYIECVNFHMYRGGVYRGPNPNVERDDLKDKMDHYGLVVGLDTEKSGKGKKAVDYWILKNSWGSSWGIEGGYMRLLRNSGRPEGICGMNLFPVYPIKRTDNPPPFQDKLIRNNSRFKLSAPTPYAFRRRSLKAAAQPNKVLELLSLFIIELSIVEHGMNLAAEGQHPSTESLSIVPLNYVEQKFERMRGILIDWLIKVRYKFEQMDDTSDGLQLVGATLPCKYQQVFASVLEDLILISDKSYCRKELFDMEQVLINNTLLFNLSYAFMRCFLKAAQSDKRLELLSLIMYKEWSEICERHVIYNDDHLMKRAKTEPAEFLPVDAET